IVLTGGDDRLWKTWAFPDGNILLTGEGHTDWLSGCCFRPREERQLGWMQPDSDVLRQQAQAVTAPCSLHLTGLCAWRETLRSKNQTWQLGSERCRYTLRGHEGSVNSIEFLPFSSTALTSSADKTLSLWDVRT
ncbi:SPG16 protein, partial [Leiothrix lutea]|nr:SPG16 protein [Leiothrix lutea]